jgi:hypothetical protein
LKTANKKENILAQEPQATHGQTSLPQSFLPCGQTAIRLFLAWPRLGEPSNASGTRGAEHIDYSAECSRFSPQAKEGKCRQ